MATQTLRRQHRQILELVTRLDEHLDPARLPTSGHAVRGLLNTLTGVLTVHLAVEDGVVYPQLKHHEDPQLRQLASRYIDEMGGLKETFLAFVGRWKSVDGIQQSPAAFIRDARDVVRTLTRRIAAEDSELYPVVENLAAHPGIDGVPRA